MIAILLEPTRGHDMVDDMSGMDSVQSVRHEDAVVSAGSSVHFDRLLFEVLLSTTPPGVSSSFP